MRLGQEQQQQAQTVCSIQGAWSTEKEPKDKERKKRKEGMQGGH